MASGDDRRHSEPAKVYPVSGQQDCWVVEAPGCDPAKEQVRLFSGNAAQRKAVQFAHEFYGGARVFAS